jgi:hypothetical protein
MKALFILNDPPYGSERGLQWSFFSKACASRQWFGPSAPADAKLACLNCKLKSRRSSERSCPIWRDSFDLQSAALMEFT